MPPRALKQQAAPITDDTSLYAGIANLATSYFDTTSEFTKHIDKAKEHFSFQTVKGLDWQDAVSKIVGDKSIADFAEGGKDIAKTALKGAFDITAGGATLSAAVISALVDGIIDSATAAFSTTKDVQEVYEQGAWVYVDRGKKQTEEHRDEEMVGQSSMFQDSDDVMVKDAAREYYSPGFYVNHVGGTNQHIVYGPGELPCDPSSQCRRQSGLGPERGADRHPRAVSVEGRARQRAVHQI